jgi:hypothetical protein
MELSRRLAVKAADPNARVDFTLREGAVSRLARNSINPSTVSPNMTGET